MSDWISVTDATRKFGMSRATLYRLIAEGRVKRAKRAGDIHAYVSSTELKTVTTLRVTKPKPSAAAMEQPRRQGRGQPRRLV